MSIGSGMQGEKALIRRAVLRQFGGGKGRGERYELSGNPADDRPLFEGYFER